jgi:hypothetical protein
MTRREAILHLVEISDEIAGELQLDDADCLKQQTRAALRALGVTDAEIEDTEKP